MSSQEHAATARRLVAQASTAALGTVALRPEGHPFVSLVAIAADARGRPLLLLSRLAEHTKNLEASPRASILVADADANADPLAAARVTVLGACTRVGDDEREAARAVYLARHPGAAQWASFADFGFFRLEPLEIRVVAGFGRMTWLSAADYFSQVDIAPRS